MLHRIWAYALAWILPLGPWKWTLHGAIIYYLITPLIFDSDKIVRRSGGFVKIKLANREKAPANIAEFFAADFRFALLCVSILAMNGQHPNNSWRPLWLLKLNTDLTALLAGVGVGFILLPLLLMLRDTDVLTLLVRTGITFLITYVAVFLLLHIGQWIIYNELRRERQQQAAARQAQEEQDYREQSGDTHEAT